MPETKKIPGADTGPRQSADPEVLGLPELDFQLALEIVTYHQQRNFVAYCSHRKRTLKTLKQKRAHHYTVHHSSHSDLTPLRGYRPRGLIGFVSLSMPPRKLLNNYYAL